MSIIKLLIPLILLILISGCTPQRVRIEEVPADRVFLSLPDPAPLKLTGQNWLIITPDNIETTWKEFRENGTSLVLFALTDDGYKQLTMDYGQIRNLINEQRNIIKKYKEYYETPAKEPPKTLLQKLTEKENKDKK